VDVRKSWRGEAVANGESTRFSFRRAWHGARVAALWILVLGACAKQAEGAARFPGASWSRYGAPEEAGWSAEGLRAARALYDEIGSDAFLVVFDGAVLVAWGDVERRFMCHSVRKSFLSALVGIHVGEGRIDLEKTLEDLGIDDVPPLTAEEKQARVIHLLKSRSGVYHPAAYETPTMKERRPARGSAAPDEFWYYNNWDFNALCTIFERETGARFFEEFERRIADPLEMEDFRLMDTYYHLERQHSVHPAYPFRMSARDMARFGLLFLRDGTWGGTEIISLAWVAASRRSYSAVPYWEGYGYGYLWWVNTDETDRTYGMYAALGYGGHMIAVLPSERMVFVHRSNTFLNEKVGRNDLLRLIGAVLDAKVSSPRPVPEIIPLESGPEAARAADRAGPNARLDLEKYEGSFRFDEEVLIDETIPYIIGDMIGRSVSIEAVDGRLLMTDNLGQRYFLIPRLPEECLVEDMEVPLRFEFDDAGRPERITLDGRPAWMVSGVRAAGADE
jgi:CubicO group peptidase (beta-lactamase class C family)